ncbi:MAG: alpha/beta hydrolase [Chloroflexi bacterium]|nr:alpha/beta hydrolase [Chloroflexota bacterium]
MESATIPQSPSLAEAAAMMGLHLDQVVEPAERFVTLNGLRFHYLDWGAAGQPYLLLLHGGFQTAHSWDFFSLAMRRSYHVLALDQRGHGDTDWAPDGEYSAEAHQRDLDAFAASLGIERLAVCGLSMGGRNAFTFAARRPELARALVIVDVGPEIRRRGVDAIRRFITRRDELDSFEAFVQRAHRFNRRRPLEQFRGSLRHALKELPNGKWTWKYDQRLRDPSRRFRSSNEDEQATQQAWERVKSIRCPTLIVRGEVSDIFSEHDAAKLHAAIPSSQLVVVPRAGHLVQGDNPVAFEAAVRPFLESQAARFR